MECCFGKAGKKKKKLSATAENQILKKLKEKLKKKKNPEFDSQVATVCEAIIKHLSPKSAQQQKDLRPAPVIHSQHP